MFSRVRGQVRAKSVVARAQTPAGLKPRPTASGFSADVSKQPATSEQFRRSWPRRRGCGRCARVVSRPRCSQSASIRLTVYSVVPVSAARSWRVSGGRMATPRGRCSPWRSASSSSTRASRCGTRPSLTVCRRPSRDLTFARAARRAARGSPGIVFESSSAFARDQIAMLHRRERRGGHQVVAQVLGPARGLAEHVARPDDADHHLVAVGRRRDESSRSRFGRRRRAAPSRPAE